MVFDASPLLTFGCSDKHALYCVGQIYGAAARWAAAVRDEVRYRRSQSGWECAQQALNAAWLPAPDDLDAPHDLVEIEGLRQRFVRAGDGPRQHLGEAASIVLARRLQLPVALDDSDARTYARQVEKLTVVTSVDILREMLGRGMLSCDDGWTMYGKMRRTCLPALEYTCVGDRAVIRPSKPARPRPVNGSINCCSASGTNPKPLRPLTSPASLALMS